VCLPYMCPALLRQHVQGLRALRVSLHAVKLHRSMHTRQGVA
jgi:hypothetical protein